jgi:xylulokinase
MSLLAVDLGSSSSKAIVFDNAGAVLGGSTVEYQPAVVRGAHAEIDPEHFWTAFRQAVRAASQAAPHDPVQALAISSHGETFVPVDAHNRPLGPAILNYDTRAQAQTEELDKLLGRRRIFEITGLILHPMYPIAKIRWLSREQPETFRAAARFASIADWILVRLGGRPCIDYSLASRFLGLDVRRRTWSDELLSAGNLRAGQLAEPVQAGTVAGSLSHEAAREMSIPAGALLVAGGHDQPCAGLGMGVCRPGMASASMGTYECLLVSSGAPGLGEAAYLSALNSYCHVVPEQYVTIAYFPSGIMLKWFCDLLYPDREPRYDELEARTSAGPSGVLVSGNLIGSCNPDFDPLATGAISGLRASTGRHAIYKGIIEGQACEVQRMVEFLEAAVGPFPAIRVTGGGSRSCLGLQLRAALSGRRLERMRVQEAGCLGAAILAGVAAGVFADYNQAVRDLVSVSDSIEPEAGMAEEYRTQVGAWRAFCRALEPVRKVAAGHEGS